MFRRSPLLGAAVVYGASRSAARREIDRNEMRNAEMQRDFERKMYEQEQRLRRDQDRQERREAERRERERENERQQQIRIQRAIDDAVAQERARAAQTYQHYNTPNMGATPSPNINPSIGTGQDMRVNPNAGMNPNMGMNTDRPANRNIGVNPNINIQPGAAVASVPSSDVRKCSACGRQCHKQDKFCGACGNRLS